MLKTGKQHFLTFQLEKSLQVQGMISWKITIGGKPAKFEKILPYQTKTFITNLSVIHVSIIGHAVCPKLYNFGDSKIAVILHIPLFRCAICCRLSNNSRHYNHHCDRQWVRTNPETNAVPRVPIPHHYCYVHFTRWPGLAFCRTSLPFRVSKNSRYVHVVWDYLMPSVFVECT